MYIGGSYFGSYFDHVTLSPSTVGPHGVLSVAIVPKSKGSWNRLYQRKYSLTYRVTCASRYDGPYTIRAAVLPGTTTPIVPRIGSSYFLTPSEFDAGSFLSEIDYEMDSASANPEHSAWLVTLNYEPYDTATFGPDPTAWPTRVQFSGNRFERIAWIDLVTGQLIANSAGDPFDPPVTVDDDRTVITVVRNELVSTFDWTKTETYRNTVNRYEWNSYAPTTVKLGTISTGYQQFDSNALRWYFEVTYPFEVNSQTWLSQPVDQGYGTLSGSTYTRIFDGGQAPNEPVKLNGSGGLLTSGSPVLLSFNSYLPVDWSPLGIDLSTVLGRP